MQRTLRSAPHADSRAATDSGHERFTEPLKVLNSTTEPTQLYLGMWRPRKSRSTRSIGAMQSGDSLSRMRSLTIAIKPSRQPRNTKERVRRAPTTGFDKHTQK